MAKSVDVRLSRSVGGGAERALRGCGPEPAGPMGKSRDFSPAKMPKAGAASSLPKKAIQSKKSKPASKLPK